MINLQFDFLVDKETNTITVRREFRANRQLVWDCHTKSELLDQWWAPKPFTNTTKSMDFSAGGRWFYFMSDPNGARHYCCMDYLKIDAIESYHALDGFCDENGVLNEAMPRSTWNASFHDNGENTLVETILEYNSLADLEAVVQMGFKEGLSAGFDQLDDFLLTL